MVNKKSRWSVGSYQYQKKPKAILADDYQSGEPQIELASPVFDQLGVRWDEPSIPVSLIKVSPTDRALARFIHALPDTIWDTASLEGNTFTLPEVRTLLLDGVTVGGRTISEQQQILGLSDAYREMARLVGAGEFSLSKEISDRLHLMLAKNESLDAGMFRGEGRATGGGHVRLSDGSTVPGFDHGEGGTRLKQRYAEMLARLEDLADPRMQALAYFASATRTQYYFDGNKRTARIMAAGHLMARGFEAVSIPARKRLEFNQSLDVLFSTDDASDIMVLLAKGTEEKS